MEIMIFDGRTRLPIPRQENSHMCRHQRYSVILAALVGLMTSIPIAVAQDLAADFKRSVVDGFVQAAVKRGKSPQEAQVEGNCLYDALNTQLTRSQWAELLQGPQSVRQTILHSAMPAALVQCAHLGKPDAAAPASPAYVEPATAPELDRADSAVVARELRRIRVEEEVRGQAAQGHLVVLPTGRCIADVTVGNRGFPPDTFSVRCSDDRMRALMRQAVIRAAPLQATPGSTVALAVLASDPEPVDGPRQ
jgi:hypothetical protein